ncbi:ComEC/Rec2 family competence protein [Parabacteroides pacaensis]|uniref:ComEC/Rec2 family competence protein n=1 Tax=Parabacteroides pacaensis TaxID=2086575 RepID=UPI000D0FC4DE|nr:ComEC/Rec2 family competence protein [Parabacteroides pacaensis]
MIKELQKRPFLRLLFLWIAGTLFQYYWPNAFQWSYILFFPFVIASLGYFRKTKSDVFDKRWKWGVVFTCIWVFLSIQSTYLREQENKWDCPSQKIIAQGIITDISQQKENSILYPVTLFSYKENDTLHFCYQKVYAYFEKDSMLSALQPGDQLLLYTHFYSLATQQKTNKNFYSYLRNKRISSTAYISKENWKKVSLHSSFLYRLKSERKCLLDRLDSLSVTRKEKGILAALVLGYTGGMEKETRTSFSSVGVAHLLAVSGFHVAIVCSFITLLLSFLPPYPMIQLIKYLVTLVVIWLFVCIAGMAIPAVRAALMFSLYLTGVFFRRSSEKYNTLAMAAFILLVYDPYSIFDIGFQLSFVAVGSILYLQPRFMQWMEIRNPVIRYPWEGIIVAMSAQIGTMPLCLYAFGTFPLLFLFTNLPLTFLATLLIPVSLIWVVISPYLPMHNFLQEGIEFFIHAFYKIVELFSKIPGATLYVAWGWKETLFSYLILFTFLLYWRTRQPKIFLVFLFFIFLLLLVRIEPYYLKLFS